MRGFFGFMFVLAGLIIFGLLVQSFIKPEGDAPETPEVPLLKPYVSLAHLPPNLDALPIGNYMFAVEVVNANDRQLTINGVVEKCWPTVCIVSKGGEQDVLMPKSVFMYPVQLQVKKPGPFEIVVRLRYQGGRLADPQVLRGVAIDPELPPRKPNNP